MRSKIELQKKALDIASVIAAALHDTAAALQEVNGLPRVLVVDDNRDAALSLGAVLQALGADVRVTHDGESALEELAAFHPAAVLLDIGMPGMDGYEVAGRIRKHPECNGTVLIALTGWGQERDRHRTTVAGFNHHLVKPAEIGDLQGLLAKLA